MAVISLSAESSTLTLNGTTINDFGMGDFIELTPSNPSTSRTVGARGSVNVKKRADSDVYVMKVRVMEKSNTDVLLNSWLEADEPTILDGSLKESYSIDGRDSLESFEIRAGSFTDKPTHVKNNQDGEPLVEYTIECFAKRLI